MLDEGLSDVDCPICLDSMKAADIQHPMQCRSEHCCFNFCMNCIESLITSSKDDYMEASDGNFHVKVYLHCPNCRSDLSVSIRDTLLLRKADFLLMNKDLKDTELTESQLRLKNVINNNDVQRAIATARQYEKDFFGDGVIEEEEVDESRDDDEMGVEADLITGVHNSFRMPKNKQQLYEKSAGNKKIDKTLLRGLERVMTKDEQKEVTDLLTSGDVEKLAQAADFLMVIEKYNVKGIPLKGRLIKKSSIYGLIDECEEAHVRGLGIGSRLPSRRGLSRRRSSFNIINMEYMQMHPLPVRMPKCAEFDLSLNDNLPFSFSDDKWDGTVRDAFCRTTITPLTGAIRRQSPPKGHRGIINVLSEGRMDPDCLNDLIDVQKNRIIVKSINGEAGRKGVMKGDVVTHLNGEEFKGNANDFYQAIKKSYTNEDQRCKFTLTFNAEVPIAQALKRRAIVS